MTPERWKQISHLFEAAQQRPPTDRQAFLRDACGPDEGLRREVQALLDQPVPPGTFDGITPKVVAQAMPSSAATRLTGLRFGSYELRDCIGVGGMGEVYRARDTRLGRDVAIKVLPVGFAVIPGHLARFDREARLLASLNHPNIATLHGVEENDGQQALVMELVEGDTLSERLSHGALRVPDALTIARQIAEALGAAHEKGIVHRDLKPANVKITPAGLVKVLDFGLAKAMVAEHDGGESTDAQTAADLTSEGQIVGTAAYMSPEQARGQAVDRATDVWAFGCVLYEMLTGKPAFSGDHLPDLLHAVVSATPDWSALPADTPASIRRLLRRALAKNRRERLADMSAIRLDLDDALNGAVDDDGRGATPAQAPPPSRAVAPVAIATLAGGVLITAITMWAVTRQTPAAPAQPMRFAIVPPAAQPFAIGGNDRGLALSPDGTHLVYVSGGAGGRHLMARAIDRLEAVSLAGGDIRSPFISPDGRWVGFFVGSFGGELEKVAITGGPPIALCRFEASVRGASWGPDGTIVFATGNPTSLLSVSEAGGEPKVLTTPDPAHERHFFPSILPNGRAVLFTIAGTSVENTQVAVLDLKTGQRKILIRGGSQAEYVETSVSGRAGHLVYAFGGTLRAVRFDPDTLEVLSDPVPVLDQLMMFPIGTAEFAVSRTGALVYAPAVPTMRSLVWVDRQGHEEPIKAPLRGYVYPRLSPDGTQVALDIRDQENDIWIWNLARETLRRLTLDPRPDQNPVWTPGGRSIIFSSAREGALNLFSQPVDTTGAPVRLSTSPNAQFAASISPEGSRLIFWENMPTGGDLKELRIDRAPIETRTLVQTPFTEQNGELSPDGHWLAYESNEFRQFQIYVRPFPNVDGTPQQISFNGGTRPLWARNGHELFYLDAETALTAVPIQTTPALSAGKPTKLFEGHYALGAFGRTYDVSPDGKRFLMIKDKPAADQSTPASMVVVLNWVEELKARVPTK